MDCFQKCIVSPIWLHKYVCILCDPNSVFHNFSSRHAKWLELVHSGWCWYCVSEYECMCCICVFVSMALRSHRVSYTYISYIRLSPNYWLEIFCMLLFRGDDRVMSRKGRELCTVAYIYNENRPQLPPHNDHNSSSAFWAVDSADHNSSSNRRALLSGVTRSSCACVNRCKRKGGKDASIQTHFGYIEPIHEAMW